MRREPAGYQVQWRREHQHVRIGRDAQMRNAGARYQERAAAIDLMHQIVALGVGLQRRREADGTGVVDTDVDAAEFGDGARDCPLDLLLEADIALERERPAAGLAYLLGGGMDGAGELRMRRAGLGGDGHIGAVARGTQCDRQADAARGAGDEQRFARQRGHVGTPNCLSQATGCQRRGVRASIGWPVVRRRYDVPLAAKAGAMKPSSGQVRIERIGELVAITLARPEKKNALSAPMYRALTEALRLASTEQSVHAVLVDADGDDFCAGNDIADFMAQASSGQGFENSEVLAFLRALAAFDKPLVAAVRG